MGHRTKEAPRLTQRERVELSAERLLQAAVELIAEQGFERTTTAEISERAGYSNSMVHVRYGSKEALLESLLRSYEEQLVRPPAEDAQGLEELLGQVDALRVQARDNREFMRAFFVLCFETVGPVPGLRTWLIDWLGRYVERVAAIVRDGQADGSIRADVDPGNVARQWLDMGTGAIFRWVLDPAGVDFDIELVRWRDRFRDWLDPPG